MTHSLRYVTALLMLALAAVLGGCHRGSQDEIVPEQPPKLDVTYMNDRGVTATGFEVGDSVFASIGGLKPRTSYDVALHGPVTPAAPPIEPAATGAGGPPAAPSEASGSASARGTARPPASGAPEELSPEEAGTSDPEVLDLLSGQSDKWPAGQPSPTADGMEPARTSPAPVSTPTEPPDQGPEPTGGEETAPAAASEESEPAPALDTPSVEEPIGALVAQGSLITDGEGKIPATAIARSIGVLSGSGIGQYTLLVTSEGTEVGRSTFVVTEGSRPLVHASDATGKPVLRFTRNGDTSVWVAARKLPPSTEISVFIVPDSPRWKNGDGLDPANGRVVEGTTDAGGKLLVEVWPAPDRAGAYDVVLDLDNDGLLSPDDVVTGVWTTGFVVADDPLVRGEVDLVTRLACGEDVYAAGPRGQLGSDESLFVFGAPPVDGALTAVAGSIHVVPHRDTWADGDELISRRAGGVSPPAIDPAGLTRVLAWPEPMLPGRYDIVVDVDGNGVYTKGTDLVDNISAGEAGVIVSDAGNLVTVRGTVVDDDGAPIGGAVVSSDAAASDVTTTAEGTFALTQVLPIPTTLRVVADGFAPATVSVSAKPTEVEVTVPKVVLASGASAGSPYFPLVDGAEWKYTINRTITRKVTVAGLATESVTTQSGTMVRGLAASSDGTYVLTETETVFVESADPDMAGERTWTRSVPLEQAPAGLSRAGSDGGLWLPAEVVDGAEYVAGPFDFGEAKVSGRATLATGASATADSGQYSDCVLIEMAPASGLGFDLGNTTATGTVKLWLAPEVGEVRREATVSLDLLGKTPVGESMTGAVTVTETLNLMRADL
ncbi:MAG: carboxypeptidase regulatory-like domain-containing protein [Armatimonadetes bacterium]|nr:carboxypeptidase regulatory-like domain-containing protein [Armatimonadota bacterium]NLN89831.1 hypothetical protein [candidate division WS1 bacterium]